MKMGGNQNKIKYLAYYVENLPERRNRNMHFSPSVEAPLRAGGGIGLAASRRLFALLATIHWLVM